MNGPLRAAVEQQITQLTANDRPEVAARFAASIRANVRNWEERLASPTEAKAAHWLLLEAYVARVQVTEDPREIFHAEKLAFARQKLQELLRADGDAYAGEELVRLRLVTQLLGGERAKTCREAFLDGRDRKAAA